MKRSFSFKCILVFVCMLQGLVNSENSAKMETKWFVQYLDHFNVWDNRTFLMRYFENNEFFRLGGPLLLEIGGEGPAETDSLKSSPSYLLAKKLRGKIVLLEHRYYGESAPFDNFTAETLKYLSVEQALEDLAYFVESYKKTTPGLERSKVGAFGCSYAASLATWFRYKFPHLVDAAWASSGPLLVALDFYEYFEVAGEVYSNVSSECIAIIRQGYREAIKLLSTPEGQEEAKDLFQDWECENVTEMSTDDILAVMRIVVANQYGSSNHAVESCKFLQSKNATTTYFQQLAEFVLLKAEDVCFEEDPNDALAWVYQTCTELGYSFTTSSPSQPFKDNCSVIDDDLRACSTEFGEEFNLKTLQRSIDRMNRVYGSTNLKVTRVISVHGTHDPWHKMGLYHQTDKETPVLLIPGTSHCADRNEKKDPEPRQLTRAKVKATEIMKKWLKG